MVYRIVEGPVFSAWLSTLRDRSARQRIVSRIDRFRDGNPGDVKPVGQGVSEMRIDYGPGYRVYFVQVGDIVYLLAKEFGDETS
jgi:putative addiction module killer protein